MTALCLIEPIIWATDNNRRTIEALLDCDRPGSIETAIDIAHDVIDFLLTHIGKDLFQPAEKLLIAEQITAFATFAIDRAYDVIEALGRVRLDDGDKARLDGLVNALREAKLAFVHSDGNLNSWAASPENYPPQGEHHAQS